MPAVYKIGTDFYLLDDLKEVKKNQKMVCLTWHKFSCQIRLHCYYLNPLNNTVHKYSKHF